jgi:hypothetical protein
MSKMDSLRSFARTTLPGLAMLIASCQAAGGLLSSLGSAAGSPSAIAGARDPSPEATGTGLGTGTGTGTGTGAGAGASTGSGSGTGAGAPGTLTNSAPLARGLIGTLQAPDSRLISNNSANLIDLGGGAFYRVQAAKLAQQAVAGAEIVLVDAAGATVTGEAVKTDSSGRFALPAPPAGKTYLIRATFSTGGKTFRFEAPAVSPATGDAGVAIDAATTMISAKIKQLAARATESDHAAGAPPTLDAAALERLTARIQAALEPGNIPYMAEGAGDILSAFDQLLVDDPDIRAEAGLAGAFTLAGSGQATRSLADIQSDWTVKTIADSGSLTAARILPAGVKLQDAGDFDVDAAGKLYFPALSTGSAPVIVYRSGQGELPLPFARLPRGPVNPVLVSVAPSGILHVAAVDPQEGEIQVFAGSGDLIPLAAFPTDLTPADFARRAGRLQVEPDGQVVLPRPDLDTIARFKPSVSLPTPAPYRISTFTYPTIPPIVIPTPPPVEIPTPVPDLPVAVPWPSIPPIPAFPAMPALPAFPGLEDVAAFNFPLDFALGDGDRLLLADDVDGVIRQALNGGISVLAGKAGERGYRNGRGAFARFAKPSGVASAADGTVFILDAESRRIRRLSPEGSVFLVAGTGQAAVADGPGTAAAFNSPRMLRRDGSGNLYLLDTDAAGREYLRKVAAPDR